MVGLKAIAGVSCIEKSSQEGEKMTIQELINEVLKERGYDGLFCPDADCACEVDHLFPCDQICIDAEPGYKVPSDGGDVERDWMIVREKP